MAYLETFRIGYRKVPIKVIQVQQLENDNDWQFVFTKVGNGKLQMAVF